MSNENPNNTSQWRNKLDELERLPGYSFNGDAAWDKLYGRLRGSTKSKKISWYWIAAAACVLFTLMITLLTFHKSISGPPDKETAVKQGKEINKPTLKTGEANKEIEGGRELINDEITSAPRKHTQRKRRVVATGFANKVQSDDIAVNYPEREPVANRLQIVNNNSTTAIIPPKKKLNVVHINELGDPVIETADMAGKIGKHSFKLGNQEVYANPSVYKNTDFTILKTKL